MRKRRSQNLYTKFIPRCISWQNYHVTTRISCEMMVRCKTVILPISRRTNENLEVVWVLRQPYLMHGRKLSQSPSLPVDVGMWQVIEGTSLSYSRAGYSQCLPTNELNHLSCSCLMGKLIVWTKRRVACGKYESKNPMIKEHASATATTNSQKKTAHIP